MGPGVAHDKRLVFTIPREGLPDSSLGSDPDGRGNPPATNWSFGRIDRRNVRQAGRADGCTDRKTVEVPIARLLEDSLRE